MKRRFFICTIALLMALVMLTGCFSNVPSGSGNNSPSTNNKPSGNSGIFDKPSSISGNDVFRGERFNEMLWGYYAAENYDYNGSRDDSAQFRDGMKYITIPTEYGDKEIAALPLNIQMGLYTHMMSSFAYEGEYYDAYTELGRAMFRKAYMEEFGDLTEEDFQKIEYILQLDVAEITATDPDGSTYIYTLAYTVSGDTLSLYTLEVDEQYNTTISEDPIVEYTFLHDGGKLILDYKGVQRNYITSGYKATDSSLTFSGYALNEKNRYQDLEGFSMFQYGTDDDISVYVELSNDESPIDPVMELDRQTGNFTLSWQQRWVNTSRGLAKEDDPQTITGTIVPCTNYGFTNYSGFFMFIDGTMYRYLMSQEEFDERKQTSMADPDQTEDLSATKRNLLAELEAAFRAAGLEVAIDYDTGKVTLEANFLFATNSYELSQEGKEYLNSFTDVYTSVVLKDEYSSYVSNIIVEGHTDTSGSYSLNQTLSQNRANAVADLCIARNSRMANVIQAVGCSYDYPVYNDDGTVNMAKSRRVTFRFVLTSN